MDGGENEKERKNMIVIQMGIHIILIFILAVITHKSVSISGSYLHEIGRVQEPYAVFTAGRE